MLLQESNGSFKRYINVDRTIIYYTPTAPHTHSLSLEYRCNVTSHHIFPKYRHVFLTIMDSNSLWNQRIKQSLSCLSCFHRGKSKIKTKSYAVISLFLTLESFWFSQFQKAVQGCQAWLYSLKEQKTGAHIFREGTPLQDHDSVSSSGHHSAASESAEGSGRDCAILTSIKYMTI